jgi:hypothetical protein
MISIRSGSSDVRPHGAPVHLDRLRARIMDTTVSRSIAPPLDTMKRESEDSRIPKHPDIELVVCSEIQSNSMPSGDAGKTVRKYHSKPSINLQLAVLYYTIFLLGFQDGTLGPLLPLIQRIYHVSFV